MAKFEGKSDKSFSEAVKDAIRDAKRGDVGAYKVTEMSVEITWKENPGGVGQYRIKLDREQQQ